MSPEPKPGIEALIQALQQGPQPQGQIAGSSMTNLLMGLNGQGQDVQGMSPELQAQLSAFLRNTVNGEGASAEIMPMIG